MVHKPNNGLIKSPVCINVNISENILGPEVDFTKCFKLFLEIDDFILRAQTNVISEHFQI